MKTCEGETMLKQEITSTFRQSAVRVFTSVLASKRWSSDRVRKKKCYDVRPCKILSDDYLMKSSWVDEFQID